jgi:cytochrome c oxidase subunit 3
VSSTEHRGAGADDGYAGRPHLAHHFDDQEQQYTSGKLGIWLFLVTEILLFGGLFCAYAVYRANHPEIFLYAHTFLDKTLGGINTVVLLFSSLTMAWAVRAAQLGQRRLLMALLATTLLCACGFLGIKAVEYDQKWKHGLLWGKRFDYESIEQHAMGAHGAGEETGQSATAPPTAAGGAPAGTGPAGATGQAPPPADISNVPPSAVGPGGLAVPANAPPEHAAAVIAGPVPRNVHIFFGIYFAMTGLHGLHVIAGMVVIIWLLVRARRGDFGRHYFAPVDFGGLYWHLVDVIWIFLFPLLYLIH